MKVGDKITFIAGGKVSRLDGVSGKRVRGEIIRIEGPDCIIVKRLYPSQFSDLPANLSITHNKVELDK
jgi:hypothetical protein